MDDLQADEVLHQLREQDGREGWTRFLDRYSPILFDVVRRFERHDDDVTECYLYVCEQLSADRFRRLLKFRVPGPAQFTTWLRAVARNLCLDWHRREFGRHRVFDAVARMDRLDQEIFRGVYEDRLTLDELFVQIAGRHEGLTIAALAERAESLARTLTPRQRWLLAVRSGRGAAGAVAEPEVDLLSLPAETPSPETLAGVHERRVAVLRAMARLAPQERLVIRLRFGHDLTLGEIAKLLNLETPQAADRRIREILDRLRAAVHVPKSPRSAGKAHASSV